MVSGSFDEQIERIEDLHYLVRLLLNERQKLPSKLRKKILVQGDVVVPSLISVLNMEALHMEGSPGDGWAPIHAAALLGELKAEEAIQPMLRWLLETEPSEHILHGQLTTSLGLLGEVAYPFVLEAFEKADEDYRLSLCDVLVNTGIKNERIFNIILDYLHTQIDYGAMISSIYGDAQAIPYLRQALKDWKLEDVTDRLMANQEVIELCAAIKELGGTLTPDEEIKLKYVKELRAEYREEIDSMFQMDDEYERNVPIRNLRPKLGRNAPCWCGSGKKYKKCHWSSDQNNDN